jgi:hypothetical protein
MSTLARRPANCAWCRKSLGWTAKDYCNAACKQAAYRYRKRGYKEPRKYTKWPSAIAELPAGELAAGESE